MIKIRFPNGTLIAFGLVLFVGTACERGKQQTLRELEYFLDSLEAVYAPDQRLALWDIQLESANDPVLEGEVGNAEAHAFISEEVEHRFPSVRNNLVLLPGAGGVHVNALANNSVIHLRREPSSKTELVTQALLGAPLCLLKEEGGKALVQLADGYLGWVNLPEIKQVGREELEGYRRADKIIITSLSAFSYAEPDGDAMTVSDLVPGNILVKVGKQHGYFRVRYPDGREAFVAEADARPVEEIFSREVQGEGIVATAMKFNGIPYLWGGVSSKNLDCSGLVSTVFFMHGIQMPRDADMQSYCGLDLGSNWDYSTLEAGDLMFFGRKATAEREERVTHVAIYMGEGKFIHAAGYRERVSINHMDPAGTEYIEDYPDIFIRAVRIIGQEGEGFGPVSENAFFKEIF